MLWNRELQQETGSTEAVQLQGTEGSLHATRAATAETISASKNAARTEDETEDIRVATKNAQRLLRNLWFTVLIICNILGLP